MGTLALRMNLPTARGDGRLLIADDKRFAEDLSRALRSHSFECITVTDGPSAFQIAENEDIDAFISDPQVLGNNDFETVRAIHSLKSELPIFLLSAGPRGAVVEKLCPSAVSGCFTKPPNLELFVSVLKRTVKNYRLRRRPEGPPAASQSTPSSPAEVAAAELKAIEEHPAVSASLRRIATRLNELAEISQVFSNNDLAQVYLERANLLSAVQFTISVLERTRKSFKSKELGELRKHLTQIVEGIQE